MPLERAIWIDEGNDADYAKLKATGITAPYYSLRDPRVTLSYLQAVRARGFQPGVYTVKSWWPQDTPQEYATRTSRMLEAAAPGTSPNFPTVMLDYETDDVAGQIACLRQWRRYRRERVTDLTIEGHKGGIYTAAQLLVIAALVRYLVPQAYNGAMTQVWDSFAMVKDLTDAGMPYYGIRPFYDAAALESCALWWEGFAFTQGRLP